MMVARSKKKITAIVSIAVAAILLLAIGQAVFSFFRSTYTRETIPAECARISAQGNRKATLFVEHTSDDLPGYSLWVANNGNADAPQELYVYREGTLGRFHKLFDPTALYEAAEGLPESDAPVSVGFIQFAPRDEEDQKSPLQTAVLYSANEERISLCRYTLKMNGVETTLEKEVYPGRDFIITVPGIGKKDGIEMKLMKASFYRADGSEVYTNTITYEPEQETTALPQSTQAGEAA